MAESSQPSMAESSQPSMAESSQPSMAESSQPSMAESSHSSMAESSQPSMAESSQPSMAESSQPSMAESSQPSMAESSQPSMAESSQPSMAESSRSREQFVGMSANSGLNNACVMEKLDTYLKLVKKCMERVQGLPSPKFNNEQCGYLVDKLKATFTGASLFMEGSQDQPCGPYISMKLARQVKNFEHLIILAKRIEGFVEGCSKDAWMQSAMTLASAAEYVSSLGFNLELCEIAFRSPQPTHGGLTIDEVDRINKSEAKIVENMAFTDADSLMKSVVLQLNSSNLEDQNLAKYLIHRLVGVQPTPTSNDENIIFRLFEWVVSGKKFKQLGRGSSATVYEVMWLGTPVAKKTFDGPENEEFLREVEILSQLCHPNITSMFCCHMNKRSCSIIMELMDGNLRDMIQGRLERNSDAPPFTMLEGLDIMSQVGEGVNYLHNKRIVHRDLKSPNILIKSLEISGLELGHVQAKVVDFGLSKTKQKSTTFSNMTYNTGTFRWMAPEVINIIKGNQESIKANVNLLKHVFKVDIYSFAMVCFEILTGEVPFGSENVPRKVKEKILKGERPRIPDYCPLVLKSLIEKCWSQVPSERPSIGDVCLQLKYIKCLLMTSQVDQECNSLLAMEPFEVVYLDNQSFPLDKHFQVRIYSPFLKELLVPNGNEYINGHNLFYDYDKLKKRHEFCTTELRAQESATSGDVERNKELKHINYLLSYMDKEFSEIKTMYRSMEIDLCATWKMLWAFFPPGEMVTYLKELSDKRLLGKVLETYYEDTYQGPKLFVTVMTKQEANNQSWSKYVSILIKQGKRRLDTITYTISVAKFEGFRSFMELNVYPIRFEGMHQSPNLETNSIQSDEILDKVKVSLQKDHKGKKKFLEHGKMTIGEIKKCTNNFGRELLISNGRYTMVYNVVLQDGREVVIKRLLPATAQSYATFLPQVTLVSRLKHENVVELMGYCVDGEVMALAFEYASMGSLRDILHGKKGERSAKPRVVLDWMQRVKIAVDVAKGLEYFHMRSVPPNIHGNICSSNVLLFHSCKAKVDTSDFWKLEPKEILGEDPLYYHPGHWVSYLEGCGAPEEYMANSEPTQKSDVYSFGVVLLELLTGRKHLDPTLPPNQRNLLTRVKLGDKVLQLIDPKLKSRFPQKDAIKMVGVVDLCLQYEADFRPHISAVVKYLQQVLKNGHSSKGQ